jgi:hypothetical protein
VKYPIAQLLILYLLDKGESRWDAGKWLCSIGIMKLADVGKSSGDSVFLNAMGKNRDEQRRDDIAGACNDIIKGLADVTEGWKTRPDQTRFDLPFTKGMDKNTISRLGLTVIQMCMSRRLEKPGHKAFKAAIENSKNLLQGLAIPECPNWQTLIYNFDRFAEDASQECLDIFWKSCQKLEAENPEEILQKWTLFVPSCGAFLCCVCRDEFPRSEAKVGLLCGHACMCRNCEEAYRSMRRCPLCRHVTPFVDSSCAVCKKAADHVKGNRAFCATCDDARPEGMESPVIGEIHSFVAAGLAVPMSIIEKFHTIRRDGRDGSTVTIRYT